MCATCKKGKKLVISKLKPVLEGIGNLGCMDPENLLTVCAKSLSRKDLKNLHDQIYEMKNILKDLQVLITN